MYRASVPLFRTNAHASPNCGVRARQWTAGAIGGAKLVLDRIRSLLYAFGGRHSASCLPLVGPRCTPESVQPLQAAHQVLA